MFRTALAILLPALMLAPGPALAEPRAVDFTEFNAALMAAIDSSGVFHPGTSLTVTGWLPESPGSRRQTTSTYTTYPDGSLTRTTTWTPDDAPDPEFFPGYGTLSVRCTSPNRCWMRLALQNPPTDDCFYPERCDPRWHRLPGGLIDLRVMQPEDFRLEDMESWYPDMHFTYTIDATDQLLRFVTTFGHQAGDPMLEADGTATGETYARTWMDTLIWTVRPGSVEWTETQSDDGVTQVLIQRRLLRSSHQYGTVTPPKRSAIGPPATLGYLCDGELGWNPPTTDTGGGRASL